MSKYNFSIVISAYGNKLDIFLENLKNSIHRFYPDIKISVYGKNNEKELKQIEEIKSTSEKFFSPGSLKIILWNKGLIDANTEWILFLDADTLLLQPLDYLFEFCISNKIDFLFSWREKKEIFVNSGVMLVRKNKSTLNFFSLYKNSVLKDVLNKENDQQSFIKLLSNNMTFKSIKDSTYAKKKEFIFNFGEINFGSLPCEIMNNSYPIKELNDQTLIQHYKGVLGTIISKDIDYRYEKLLNYDLFRYSLEEIRRINFKLNIWKSFSDLDNKNLPIDIYNYYKRKIYKRYFVLFFELIKKPIKNIIKSFISFLKKLK